MYYILGYNSITDSISKAINSYDLSFYNYDEFLKENSVFSDIPDKNTPLITSYEGGFPFCYDYLISLKNKFSNNSKKIDKMIKDNTFYKWLNILSKNEQIYKLINRIIKIIVINKLFSYTNGTTQDTIGLTFIDFKDNFNYQDFLELIFHQLIHMILFIDDIVHFHMENDTKFITIEVEGVKSVFHDNKFPLYTLFHSYIVGIEILMFRKNFFNENSFSNYHGSTDRIINLCKKFSIAIEKNIYFFSTRSKYIFEKSKKIIN
ncbi:hypothetical protein [Xenorhabdus eapokensis]|uniref:Uncharacterized protein n=1 Tax=Xenorhabdus eapokensis TaxID=1873482 RepID=A0A1Q5TX73_9GAMM|nr:hypothetical protein [Xenorhabdus eapokensis]OKP04812.1 hypothetical protein Xedl_00711 [Xenorhabdus eapokensis]OKP05245.1 hypothetical protein Xedl_00469 [Xenorhabdus eapokensis]